MCCGCCCRCRCWCRPTVIVQPPVVIQPAPYPIVVGRTYASRTIDPGRALAQARHAVS